MIKPIKRLGQNFLADKKILEKIIEVVRLASARGGQAGNKIETILEIGPGEGVLTQELIKISDKVIAVEKDPRLFEYLKNKFKGKKNLELINDDILKTDPVVILASRRGRRAQNLLHRRTSGFRTSRNDNKGVLESSASLRMTKKTSLQPPPYQGGGEGGGYIIVANLPYYITSPAIRKFLESSNPPKEMYLMVQKEVAQRIIEKDGKSSILSIMVHFYSTPEILFYVPKTAFRPIPKVDSAFIKLEIKSSTPVILSAHDEVRKSKDLFGKLKTGLDLSTPLRSAQDDNRVRRSAQDDNRVRRSAQDDKEIKRFTQNDTKEFFRLVKIGFASKRKTLSNNLSAGYRISKDRANDIIKTAGFNLMIRAEGLKIKDWMKLYGVFQKQNF